MNYVENMKKLGFTDDFVQKVTENKDFEAIRKIMDESVSFEDAAAKVKEEFPSINIDEVRKNLEELEKQNENAGDSSSDEVVDLEDDALEAVAGGSVGSWFKSNWKSAGLAFMVGGVLGLVVDYVGIASALKAAMNDYTARDKKNYGDTDVATVAYPKFLEKLSICRDLFHGFDYSGFLSGSDCSPAIQPAKQ